MAKFSTTKVRNRPARAATVTGGHALTHEGGHGHARDLHTELYLLAVTNMVSETTFYESAGDRDDRFRRLVHAATQTDPAWTAQLITWLRSGANMRSAAAVAACEYVAAGGPGGRDVIASACQRADEPGEVLAYWLSRHGRTIPKPVKRGLADAAARLYNEYALLKYDTPNYGVRFADVIGLCRPAPTAAWQAALFRHAADRRRGRHHDDRARAALAELPTVTAAYRLDGLPSGERRAALAALDEGALRRAGYTWERLSGWLPDGMDAAAWEAVIPTMGIMAVIRNLRNFEDAKVDPAVLDQVAARIADREVVAGSRQFPFRWWSAYKNSGTMRFGPALEDALQHSVANVPVLRGRTLVMVDTSASMNSPLASRSAVTRIEAAAVFAGSVAARSDVVLCPYANSTYRAQVHRSVLRTVDDVRSQIGRVGHGTMTWTSTRDAIDRFGPFDRVIVFTDEQSHWERVGPPAGLPVYVWDLAGYKTSTVDTSVPGHYVFGGFTDAAFRMVELVERGRDAGWPWTLT